MIDVTCQIPGDGPSTNEIRDVLAKARKIAVVGLSPKEERDSHKVARYLMRQGYEIIPVNPGQREILDQKCYKTLEEIPFAVDVADLFVNPSRVPSVVDQAIKKGVGVVWMQLGVIHDEAARKATDAGIKVIMDRCMKQEHEKMISEGHQQDPMDASPA